MIYSLFVVRVLGVGFWWYNVLMTKTAAAAEADNDTQTGWKYTGTVKDVAAGQTALTTSEPVVPANIEPVTWSASEYVEHDKSAGWYLRFALVSVVGIGVIYFLTGEWVSVVLLAVLAMVFGLFAARKPQVLQYSLDNQGITIGAKLYPISSFRSFAVVEEGAFRSIMLLPMKRFMPAISLYFAPDNEEVILETFSKLLPEEARQQDRLDKFMHRIRF